MDLPTARLRETQLKFCPGNSNLGQVDKNKSSQGPFIYLFIYLFVCLSTSLFLFYSMKFLLSTLSSTLLLGIGLIPDWGCEK